MGLNDETREGVPLLTPADYALVMAKNAANRLGFALLLVLHPEHGRFPPSLAKIDYGLRAQVAGQLGQEPTCADRYDPLQRTWKRARAEIRKRYRDGQEEQLTALGLVTNAVVFWNTIYMEAALEQLRTEGFEVRAEDVARLSPLQSRHTNILGRYAFLLAEAVANDRMRPLSNPDEDDIWA
jgi:hypothetical protein